VECKATEEGACYGKLGSVLQSWRQAKACRQLSMYLAVAVQQLARIEIARVCLERVVGDAGVAL